MEPIDDKLALEIVDGALGLSKGELEAYLDRVCGENSLLRREVLDYLNYDPQPVLAGGGIGEGSLPELPDAKVSETRYQLGDEIARGGMGVPYARKA